MNGELLLQESVVNAKTNVNLHILQQSHLRGYFSNQRVAVQIQILCQVNMWFKTTKVISMLICVRECVCRCMFTPARSSTDPTQMVFSQSTSCCTNPTPAKNVNTYRQVHVQLKILTQVKNSKSSLKLNGRRANKMKITHT